MKPEFSLRRCITLVKLCQLFDKRLTVYYIGLILDKLVESTQIKVRIFLQFQSPPGNGLWAESWVDRVDC
jgi:hypothetical protein